MNGAGIAPRRIFEHLAAVVLFACVVRCGDHVNLGGSSSPPPDPDPDASLDPSAPPTTLYQFHQGLFDCIDVAVDDTYVYLSTAGPDGLSIHRCRKRQCAATMQRIIGPLCGDCGYDRIAVLGDHLGLVQTNGHSPPTLGHIDACTRPDCTDLRQLIGGLPRISAVAFDENRVEWHIDSDHSIYQCSFPSCNEGPRTFAMGVPSPGSFATSADWVYWLARGTVTRKPKNESSPAETLELGAVLGRAPDAGTGAPSGGLFLNALAIDAPWIYALSWGSPEAGPDVRCGSSPSCLITRWPEAFGGAREIVLNDDQGGNGVGLTALRVFQGEVVFSSDQAYACDADKCASTRRPIGQADPSRMASDDDYLYWCTITTPDRYDMLQRIARARHTSRGG
jgi:hypothetical protein